MVDAKAQQLPTKNVNNLGNGEFFESSSLPPFHGSKSFCLGMKNWKKERHYMALCNF